MGGHRERRPTTPSSGTVTVCHDGSPWRELGRGDEGEFRMLAVAPQAQGQGVGAALVELCVDRFREVGAPGDRALDAPGDARRAPALRAPRVRACPAPRLEPGARASTWSPTTWTWRRDATAAQRDPDVHGHRRRHRRRRRLGQPPGARHAPAARVVRGGHLRRARAHPGPRARRASGTRISLEHLAASPVGQEVEVSASTTYVDGRLHRFTVSARHLGGDGKVIGSGEVTRVVVDAERFLGRLQG